MSGKKKVVYPEHPDFGAAKFMQGLFERMADAAPGDLTLENWTAEDAYVLSLRTEDVRVRKLVSMCWNESGLPLVTVADPGVTDRYPVIVESRAGAVLAIMMNC